MENQDAYIIEEISGGIIGEQTVCVVCDGMGGAKAGNIASGIAVEAFMRVVREGIREGMGRRELAERAVRYANECVCDKASESDEYTGMGTTLVGAIANEEGATVVNVGDSRCYLVRETGITQITKDHSLVEDMIDRGEILREEAWRHPNKNLITRVLGTETGARGDIFEVELTGKSYLLLCTDGLSNVVNPQELLFELVYGGEAGTAAERMVEIALRRNAPDNVTVAIIGTGVGEDNG